MNNTTRQPSDVEIAVMGRDVAPTLSLQWLIENSRGGPNHSAALAIAQKAAHAVEKDSKNEFHRYTYASAEDVIAEARAAFNAADLTCPMISYQVSGGLLCAVYRLTHTSGEFTMHYSETPIVPEKGRPIDKAVAAAKTFDESYALRSILLLPRIDREPDQRDDRNTGGTSKRAKNERTDHVGRGEQESPAGDTGDAQAAPPRSASTDGNARLRAVGERLSAVIGNEAARALAAKYPLRTPENRIAAADGLEAELQKALLAKQTKR